MGLALHPVCVSYPLLIPYIIGGFITRKVKVEMVARLDLDLSTGDCAAEGF